MGLLQTTEFLTGVLWRLIALSLEYGHAHQLFVYEVSLIRHGPLEVSMQGREFDYCPFLFISPCYLSPAFLLASAIALALRRIGLLVCASAHFVSPDPIVLPGLENF